MRRIEDRLLSAGVALALAAAVVSVAASARPGRYVFDLDPGAEGNAFAWASIVATFGASFAAGLHALALPERRLRLGVLAASIAFLSLDDLATVHERLGRKVFGDALDLPDNAAEQLEITVYGPLFVVILAIVWSLAREERSRIAKTLLAGAGLLALAVASELAGIGTRGIGEGDTSWENRARVGLEEAAEVSGWILVACALSAMLCGALFRAGALDSGASNAKDRSVQ